MKINSWCQSASIAGVLITAALVASCATSPTPSSVILARPEPPLMDAPVLFQRIMPAGGETINTLYDRAMPRRLIVTASEFTLPGGNGNVLTPWEFTLSYSTVETVEVRTIDYDPMHFLGRRSSVPSAVTITDQRGVCKAACVFLFYDVNGEPDLTTANRFAEIVRAGIDSVDPFGRRDGPRTVAIASGVRAPRPVWHVDIRAEGPDVRNLASEVEKTVLAYAKSTLRSDFRQCLAPAVNASSPAWHFVPVTNLNVNRETEISVSSILKSAELKQIGTNSLLVSDIYGLGFTYIPPIDNDPARVETIFRAFVDFFDLEPMKDGRYFWFDYSKQRLMTELADDPVDAVRKDIADLCEALSVRIEEEIAGARGGNVESPTP
ncbi:MAG: hypothetical protein OEM63_04950 [Gammaproteobacteria bacterium]|nr:hypothetical protein [Gammaproteobacteria bacterium]